MHKNTQTTNITMNVLAKIKVELFLSKWKKDTHLPGCEGMHVHRSYQIESIYIDLYWSVSRYEHGHKVDHQVFFTRCTYNTLENEIKRNEESIIEQFITPPQPTDNPGA